MLCLAPTVQCFWRKGLFALKPIGISDNQRELTVEFYWMGESLWEPKNLSTPPAKPTNLDGTINIRVSRLLNCETMKCICTGDKLTFTTNIMAATIIAPTPDAVGHE
ncbi:hypothetical protein BJX99DRAFT_229602 [Aspergillus californicus]